MKYLSTLGPSAKLRLYHEPAALRGDGLRQFDRRAALGPALGADHEFDAAERRQARLRHRLQSVRDEALGLRRDAEAGERCGAQAAQAAAGADDAPGPSGPFHRLQHHAAADARRRVEDQRQRLFRIEPHPGRAGPHQAVLPHQLSERVAGPALAQHEVELAGIELLVQHGAQAHRQLEIDLRMTADEIAQQIRQA
ncbi:hypothetical protein chiPu_0030299 [Chiloscyllium punctatum]|uniref:Uncharacterized protein n=1 Tax=Chiloscyllium punctatum TaxID=137246 RepID=A0A401TTR0_CHIPU|nr:hypothetical protein [Chiloscyllium punctatum]